MSVDDWVQGRAEVFTQLTLLLELVQRPAAAADSEDIFQTPCGGANFTENFGRNSPGTPAGSTDAAAASDASLPNAAMQELQDVVDDWLLKAVLALIFAPSAYIAAMSKRGSHSQACPASKQLWAQMTARMQFSDQQLRMLIAAQKEFQRLNGVAVASLPDMASRGACTPLFEAVLLRQQQQQQQQEQRSSPLSSAQQQQQQVGRQQLAGVSPLLPSAAPAAAATPCAAPTPVAAAAAPAVKEITSSRIDSGGNSGLASSSNDSSRASSNSSSVSSNSESVCRALNRHVNLLVLALQCLCFFNLNTCCPLQRALAYVASYPYYPLPLAMGDCAVEIYKKRKELQQVEQQLEQEKQQQRKKKQGNETGTLAGAVGAAADSASFLLQQMIAAEVEQHLQQRSDMMLQQLHAWGLD
jgi:hypothetical protein